MSDLLYALTLATALGCGLGGGVFFAFSAFVMEALARLPAPQGIAAMQSINRMAPTPVFMTQLLGTAVACLGLEVWAVLEWGEPSAPWVAAGGALYVVGTIGVTRAFNVPLNHMLDAVDPGGPEAAERWHGYLSPWTAWNHVRGIAAIAAAGLLTVGLAVA